MEGLYITKGLYWIGLLHLDWVAQWLAIKERLRTGPSNIGPGKMALECS